MTAVVRFMALDMKCRQRNLPTETEVRPPRTAEELDEAFATYAVNKFTEEEAYEIARRHHWRVVVSAPKKGAQCGKYYYLKGKDMSWQEAMDKLTDETDGNRSGNVHKWAAIVFWEAETGAYSRAVGEHLKQKLGEDTVYLEDNDWEESGKEEEAVMAATGQNWNTGSPAEALMRVGEELDWERCVKHSCAGFWKSSDAAYVQQQQQSRERRATAAALIAAGDSAFRLVSKLSGSDVKMFEKALRTGYSPEQYEERLRQSEEQLSAARRLFARHGNLSNTASCPPAPVRVALKKMAPTKQPPVKMAPMKNPPSAEEMRKGQPNYAAVAAVMAARHELCALPRPASPVCGVVQFPS